ncbi:MAG TPA: hypothetical protein VK943_16475, partial [Arenibaculum sp.]|nr:hypothetical protein [Arenibaculum sp.]
MLRDPGQVAQEYRRRLGEIAAGGRADVDLEEVDRRIGALRRGIGRLIDGYVEGMIERVEFEPRAADLRTRVAQLEEHRKALADAAAAAHDITMVVGRLEDFAAKIADGLDQLDWTAKRDIIRLMVRIEIDDGEVEIVFRVPPPSGG